VLNVQRDDIDGNTSNLYVLRERIIIKDHNHHKS